MRVEVVLALPREHRAVLVELPAGATVGDAVAASGLPLEGVDGYAVFGVRVAVDALLREGDRVELLRPLLLDPKDARRRRAARPRG
jgi:putative ubiquitin-RnfH superfamily antitoxin RatB of RatAB toxin-antitoxin module